MTFGNSVVSRVFSLIRPYKSYPKKLFSFRTQTLLTQPTIFLVNHKIQFTLNLLCLVAFLCLIRENFCIFPKCILKCKVKFTYNPSINVTANALKTCNSTLNSLAETRILKYVGIQNTNVGICFRIRKTLTNFFNGVGKA